MLNDYKKHYKFWNMPGIDFLNAEYIHPLKQKSVQKMLDEMRHFSEIVQVIIFGSAVDMRCRPFSDVDVFVRLEKDTVFPRLSRNWDTEVDLLYDLAEDSALMKEIYRTGIVVYERGNLHV